MRQRSAPNGGISHRDDYFLEVVLQEQPLPSFTHHVSCELKI
jgi:hypothetical protein